MPNKHAVLLSGISGVGKSSLIRHFITANVTSHSEVSVSHCSNPEYLQSLFLKHYPENMQNQMTKRFSEPKKRLVLGGRFTHLIFIDDLSMASSIGGIQC